MKLSESSSHNKELLQTGYCQRTGLFFGRFNVFDLMVIIICLASFVCSFIESTVNNDNHHWGAAYVVALDLHRGAIPYSGVIIFYGYLTTWLHSFSLSLFGERLLSIGIITGLFYSFTLYFSYLIFIRFLKKNLAFFSVLLLFLMHPYIIYPGPNYLVYTFQLVALLFFLRYPKGRYNGFLAGFFLSMAFLARFTSIQAILPPFAILLLWDFFAAKKGEKQNAIKKILIVSSGFFIPLTLFFAYLLMNSALGAFFYENKMLAITWGGIGNIGVYLNFLASILQIAPSYASDFRGKIFTLILIICLFIIVRETIRKISGGAAKSVYAGHDVMAVCLVAIFGYLNSIHVYETARLVNGAALGVGICTLVSHHFFIKSPRPLKYIFISLVAGLVLFLSSTLFFVRTTSAYYPWRTDILLHSGVTNQTIGIFKGKILTKEFNDFYQEAYDAIAPFKGKCAIINYTPDCVALIMNDLPRVQISPMHFSWLEDMTKQARLIDECKAVVLSYKPLDFPGYKTIFKKQWPDEIPWLGGGYLFIYAPKQYSDNKKVLPAPVGKN
jgi:hypothetical protein